MRCCLRQLDAAIQEKIDAETYTGKARDLARNSKKLPHPCCPYPVIISSGQILVPSR